MKSLKSGDTRVMSDTGSNKAQRIRKLQSTNLTPSVRNLLIEFTSHIHVERARLLSVGPGKFNMQDAMLAGLVEGAENQLSVDFKRGMEMTMNAVDSVRKGIGDNPWRHASDEEIAGEILRLVEERMREMRERNAH